MSPQLTRDRVPEDLTWNLADLYPTSEDWEGDFTAVSRDVDEVTRFRGTLGRGAAAVLGCLQARDKLAALGEVLNAP